MWATKAGDEPLATLTALDIEEARVCKLHLYQLLDTPAEAPLDDLTTLAASICEVPISLISLVDTDRQWFKSKHGLTTNETPRAHSFCTHAIESDEIMIVEDATDDTRFVDNPLVTNDPHIRFYAGAPLVIDGLRLGTLCVIDQVPRRLDETQLRSLATVRDAVVAHIKLAEVSREIDALHHLVPVCAWCHSVQDGGDWRPLYDFVSAQGVTHSICPTCETGEQLRRDRRLVEPD